MGGAATDAINAPKRKSKQQLPLPAVDALIDKLPISVEYKPKGRHAVAKVDMPAGTLVMLEAPAATTARTRAALHVCHRCFVPIPPPAKPAKGVKALEAPKPEPEAPASKAEAGGEQPQPAEAAQQQVQNGSGKDAEGEEGKEAVEETPAYLDPCLPRYCANCAGKNAELDARLAAVRSRLFSVCKKHQLEPELLQLLLLLDVQRGGAAGGAAKQLAQDVPVGAAPEGAAAPPAVRCGAAEVDAVPTMWDRKGEAWRKMVMTATKALHKELVALAESGAVPGYSPSSLAQLQAVAGAIGLCLQGVGPEGASVEPGLGLFPALNLFSHSCVPNCHFTVAGQTLRVRTLVDVPVGTALTVSFVPIYEPRAVRRDALRQQRALAACGCLRCTQPIEESTDRFLEGVWCLHCRTNVLVQLPAEGKWEAEYEAQAAAEAAGSSAAPAAAAAKKAAGKSGKKGKAAAAPAGTEEPAAEAAAAAEAAEADAPAEAAEADAPAEAAGGGKEGDEKAGEGGEGGEKVAAGEGEVAAAAAQETEEPPRFWRCCGCGRLERARGSNGLLGPQDIDDQATHLFSQAMMLLQMKVTGQALAQAENMLAFVRGGINGRLHPYNIHCLDAHEPLLTIQMRKGDALSVFNSALVLWEAQRLLLDLPSSSQLGYLNAIEDAARHKAANASSAVMKKQFERKAKAAQTEIAYLKKVLFGLQ